MSQPVLDTWASPTRIYASIGAAGQLASLIKGRSVVAVVDQQLRRLNPLVEDTLKVCNPEVVFEHKPSSENIDAVASLTILLKTLRDPWVLAIGGGSILDIAKAGLLLHRMPELGPQIQRGGPVFCASSGALPMIAIPTTTGTASEVSAVAMLRHNDRTTMLISPARPSIAILDPRFIEGVSETQRLAGLIEPLSRTLVPVIAGDALLLQDHLACAVMDTLLTLAEAPPAPTSSDSQERLQWNLTASLASAQTHVGFLSLGRPPALHVLWPYATELMAATGATKPRVLAHLIPAWHDRLQRGLLPSIFGTRQRVKEVRCGGVPALERVSAWCKTVKLDPIPNFDPEAIVGEVRRTWQASGLFLGGVNDADGLQLLEPLLR